MRKILVNTLCLCAFVASIFISNKLLAQEFLAKSKTEFSFFIQADPQRVYSFVEANPAIRIGSRVENYFTLYTDKVGAEKLKNQRWIQRIERGDISVSPLMDSSRILNNIDSVHQGLAPLVADYKGRNVVAGIIDFGIEWRHLDFKSGPSNTRILSIWDQNKDSIAPLGFSYGHVWKKADIDSGFCKHNASVQFGHGTNASGILAGNGTVKAENKGIATEAKIIAVSLKNNNSWLSNLVDGVNYIFAQADSQGLPAVVNVSVGSYDGSHDGRDLGTRMLEASLNKNKRSIVAAAGNAGHINQHVQFVANNDTSFTDFLYRADYGGAYFNFWSDTIDVKNLVIGLQADSASTLLPKSLPYFMDFKTKFLDSFIKNGYYEDSIEMFNAASQKQGEAYFWCIKQENTINFQCYIVPTNTSLLWRFTTTGIGKLDIWANSSLQGSSNIFSSPLPSVSINPSIINYKILDQKSSLVSSFQCSDKIITVGNYVNKYGIIDIDTIYRPIGGKQNEIASNSSKGPTRDGRLKPDISASGGQTMTTVDSITGYNFSLNATNRKKLGITGKYAVAGGTSMSSPVVAGCIALLMEKYPQLYPQDIMYLVKKTAKKDTFTSAIENNTYGYGKINAFQLLAYIPSYGCRDTGSINYNPSSDFEDSTICIKKIYGCTDTGSINYNPLANVNDSSCIKKVFGCTDTGSINYNPLANVNDSSCIKKVYGCRDTGSINYNPLANVNDGSCVKKVYGCTDTGSINYNPLANVNDSSCIKKVFGCTDPKAKNYNPKANINDSSCLYHMIAIFNTSFEDIQIFPNPTKDQLTIKSADLRVFKLTIYNLLSIPVFTIDFSKFTEIDLKHLARGIYFLELKSSISTKKIKLELE